MKKHKITNQTVRVFITGFVMAVIVVTQTSCSVFMAAKQPPKKDLSVLNGGTPRSLVLAAIGQPISTEVRGGKKVDVFSFTQGYSKGAKASRAVFHGAADVLTAGLWEIVATPTEAFFNGKKMAVEVIYDANDRVERLISLQNFDSQINSNRLATPYSATAPVKTETVPSTEQSITADVPPKMSTTALSTPSKIWKPGNHRQIWLLTVGVGQYKNPQVPVLPYAKQDAERIRDWALNLNPKQLTRENISVLTDEQATRENLLNQIDWLRKQALPDDAAIIYFAGHGAPEIATDGKEVAAKYLLLHDTNPDELFATGFSIDDLTRKLDTIKTKTQVVIFEACYTGPVGQDILKKTPTADLEVRPRFMREMGERGGRVILSASSGRQVAIGSEDLKGALFTHYLLKAWGDGSKPLLNNCFEDVREHVQRAANKLGSTQEPVKYGDQNVDIILKPQ